MLFIDGDHTFEGVRMDFNTYRSLVREDGAVVLQDIRDHHRDDVGVHRVWAEIKQRWPDRTVEIMTGDDDWGGIGILWNPAPDEDENREDA
jgi:Methyltransferase domain